MIRPLRSRPGRPRFRSDARGVSAVEFALVLPFMLLLYLGSVQVSDAVSLDRKVTLLGRTIGDLIAQPTSITTSDVLSIFNFTTAILYPYSAGDLTVTVSGYWTDKNSVSKLRWQCVKGGTCTQYNQTATIDNPQICSGRVVTKVTYTYRPAVAYGVIGTIPLSETVQMRPRINDKLDPTRTSVTDLAACP